MPYLWPHLKDTGARGQLLYDALKTHLQVGDKILDAACGYSPLAEPLLRNGYLVTGFDSDSEAIEHVKSAYPKGAWVTSSYAQAAFTGHTVLLLLGTTGLIYVHPKAMQAYRPFLDRTLHINNIRLVMLDTADGPNPPTEPWQLLHADTVRVLVDNGYTTVLRKGSYTVPHPRSYLLVGKK